MHSASNGLGEGDQGRVALFEASDLSVGFAGPEGMSWALRGFSLAVRPGSALGIVGESGSGKSTAVLAMMGLLNDVKPCRITGEALYRGESLLHRSPRALRKIWGRRISMIFQDPLSALNPVITIAEQVEEVIRAHRSLPRSAIGEEIVRVFLEVGLPDPDAIARRYPHQLSGGQLQRVMIAMALVCEPDVVIADEPTTALDLTIQAQILAILTRLCREHGVALILITHDLAVVAETTEQLAVLYSGELVEYGPTADVLSHPRHPYTHSLLQAMPQLEGDDDRLAAISGSPLPGTESVPGCRFAPRCPNAQDLCQRETPQDALSAAQAAAHRWACHFPRTEPSRFGAAIAAVRRAEEGAE